MPNMTLALDDETYALVKDHPEVSWSHVAREAIEDYARKLELLDALTGESDLSEADVEEVGREVKEAIRRRHDEAGSGDESGEADGEAA